MRKTELEPDDFFEFILRRHYTGLATSKPSPITGYTQAVSARPVSFMHAIGHIAVISSSRSIPENPKTSHLSKGGGTRVRVQLLARVDGAVGQGELEVLGEELLDVGAADAVGIGNLNNLQDLQETVSI